MDLSKDVLELLQIVSLVIARDDIGISEGFGFVNHEPPNDARKTVEYINSLILRLLCYLVRIISPIRC